MDENDPRGRNKLARFRVRRDSESRSRSKEREVGNEATERDESVRNEDQVVRNLSPRRSPSPASLRSASSSYRRLYYSHSRSRSRSPTSPRTNRPVSPSQLQTIHSQPLPISPSIHTAPVALNPTPPQIKLYLPLPLHLPQGILSDYFDSLFPPVKVYSLDFHAVDTSPFAFVVVDRELWENGEIERRVNRSEGLLNAGKEWRVRLSLARDKQDSQANGTSNRDESYVRKQHGWIGIVLEGFPEGTLKKESVELLLGRHLKYWERLEMDEKTGRVKFEVHGVKTAMVVERDLGGLRVGNTGAAIKVSIERDQYDVSLGKSGLPAGLEKGDIESEASVEKERSMKRSLSPDEYGPARPRRSLEREMDVEVEERGRNRERNYRRERGRSRSRASSRSRSRSSRRIGRTTSRDHGRVRRDREGSHRRSRKDRYEDDEDEEDRKERESNRRGRKKQISHRSSSRSRSPRRRHTHRHSRKCSRSHSRSPNPRHRHRHRQNPKSSRRSPSLAPDLSSQFKRRYGYDMDSRSRSRSRSPRRRVSRKAGYDRSISPLSSHRRTYGTHRDLPRFFEYPSSFSAPHYEQPFMNSFGNHSNLNHLQTFPPQSQSYPTPHFPTYSQAPPPPPQSYYAPYPRSHNHAYSQIQPLPNPNLSQNTYNQFAPAPTNQIHNPAAHYRRSRDAEETIRVLSENLERNRERREVSGQWRGHH